MNSAGFVDEVEPGLDLAHLLLGIHSDTESGVESRLAAVAGWERVIAWATAMPAERLVAISAGVPGLRAARGAPAVRRTDRNCQTPGLALIP